MEQMIYTAGPPRSLQSDSCPDEHAVFVEKKWPEPKMNVDETAAQDTLKCTADLKNTYCPNCKEIRPCLNSRLKECLYCDGALKFVCGRCNRRNFANYNSMSYHVKETCVKELRWFCDHCDYKTHSKINMTHHRKIWHTKHEPKPCPKCGKTMKHPRSAKRHERKCFGTGKKSLVSYHDSVEQKPVKTFKCIRCSKTFKTQSELNTHDVVCQLTN